MHASHIFNEMCLPCARDRAGREWSHALGCHFLPWGAFEANEELFARVPANSKPTATRTEGNTPNAHCTVHRRGPWGELP